MIRKILLFSFLIAIAVYSFSQDSSKKISDSNYSKPSAGHLDTAQYILSLPETHHSNQSRIWLVGAGHVVIWTGSYIALNKAWYADYPKQSFHTFNDWKEWNQMDKAGHIWTTYRLGRLSAATWKWAGISSAKSAWLGGISALAYETIIEIQDGLSAKWGFSWSDMVANIVGASAFISQELGWKEQRVQIKFSYWRHHYPADLITRRNELFGSGNIERILKDYNSQTYWLIINPYSFSKQSKFPEWLNISFGYSSDLMLSGRENRWLDKNGNTIDRTDIERMRKFYLSPDFDFTKIKTRSKLLRSVFFVASMIKIPAPALMLDSKGRFRFYALYL